MQPNDKAKKKQEPQRPNPGDPGVEVPDPDETKRVDPREDERIPEFERVDGPGPNDAKEGAAGPDALDRLKRR